MPEVPADIAEPPTPGDVRTPPAAAPPSAPAQQPPVVDPRVVDPPVVDPRVVDPPVVDPPVDLPVTISWPVLPTTAVPPTITGTGTPGSAVEVVDETGRVIATALVAADGTFAVRPDVDTLCQGISISIRHTSPISGTQTVSEPTGRTYFPVPGLAEDSDGVISRTDEDGDGRRDDLALDVRGVAGSTASVSLDGGPAMTVLFTDAATIVSFVDIRPGLHRVELRYVDPATGDLGLADTDHILVRP